MDYKPDVIDGVVHNHLAFAVLPSTSTGKQESFQGVLVATGRWYRILQHLVFVSAVRLPALASPGRCYGTNVTCHLLEHGLFVRPGTSAAIAPQFLPP
jgi:hypothetical protein